MWLAGVQAGGRAACTCGTPPRADPASSDPRAPGRATPPHPTTQWVHSALCFVLLLKYLQVKKSCIEPLKNWGGGDTPVFKSKPSPGWYSCRRAYSDENNVLHGMTTESAYTDVTTPFKDRTGGRRGEGFPYNQCAQTRRLPATPGCDTTPAGATCSPSPGRSPPTTTSPPGQCWIYL